MTVSYIGKGPATTSFQHQRKKRRDKKKSVGCPHASIPSNRKEKGSFFDAENFQNWGGKPPCSKPTKDSESS